MSRLCGGAAPGTSMIRRNGLTGVSGTHGGVDFESSRIFNVSRLDEDYEIAFEPTWVETIVN